MSVSEVLLKLWPLIAIQVGLTIWSLVDIWKNKKTRSMPPEIWSAIVIVLGYLGNAAYLFFGTSRSQNDQNDLDHD